MVDSSTPLGATAGLSSANADVPGMGVDWFHFFVPSARDPDGGQRDQDGDIPPGQSAKDNDGHEKDMEEKDVSTVCCPMCFNFGHTHDECFLDASEVDKLEDTEVQEPSEMQRKLQLTAMGGRSIAEARRQYLADAKAKARKRQKEKKRKEREVRSQSKGPEEKDIAMAHNDEDCVQTRRFV